MRTGIKELEVKYFIKKEDKVIICVISGKVSIQSMSLSQSFRVKGVAKCHEDDTFNEITGRRIAESKAKMKMFLFAKRYAEDVQKKVINPITEAVQKVVDSTEYCYQRELNHIKELEEGV